MENESFFVNALGSAPLIKVLDFLIENRIFDYSKSDIARETGVSRATLDSFWGNLVELGQRAQRDYDKRERKGDRRN